MWRPSLGFGFVEMIHWKLGLLCRTSKEKSIRVSLSLSLSLFFTPLSLFISLSLSFRFEFPVCWQSENFSTAAADGVVTGLASGGKWSVRFAANIRSAVSFIANSFREPRLPPPARDQLALPIGYASTLKALLFEKPITFLAFVRPRYGTA